MNELFVLEDLINVLIKLEDMGYENYTHMAKVSNNEQLKKFFSSLAEQERSHSKFYKGIKSEMAKYPTSEIDSEYMRYIDVMLKNAISFLEDKHKPSDIDEAFHMAIVLEKETLLFLNEMKQIIPSDKVSDINKMIEEERRHLKGLYEKRL